MKIYLWFNDNWKLVNSENKEFEDFLRDRNIVISTSAKIGDYAEIGDRAEIGDDAKIGYRAEIGDSAEIGNDAEIGDNAEIGDDAKIDDYAKIGYRAKIGDDAKIGNYAEIDDYAKIGDYAEIGDDAKIGYHAEIVKNFNKNSKDTFSELNIFIMTGVLMQNGTGTFYKSVRPNLTDIFSGKYQYKIGKGDKSKLKRSQAIECGEGWHWTSYERAIAFAGGDPHKIISVTIRQEDILSVYNKVRVNAFNNVQLVEFK